ncbi:hypothetical protein Tco_0874577 [Tanacetum coccineum]|uniref:Uncharacterized protein n=1 Tax=Tanacetum coccineum TaxID=301880 RepID=A0ABQ5BQ44_9ASTR
MTSFDYRLNPIYAIKECSSCGSLYTSNCGCSKGSLEDKILVPKPPRNCAVLQVLEPRVDGPYCKGYTLSHPNDNTKLLMLLVSIVVDQDPGDNPLKSPHIAHCCHECGDSLDGFFCRQCIFPPADRSDLYHEEFAGELAHIISPPEYDHFCFKIEAPPSWAILLWMCVVVMRFASAIPVLVFYLSRKGLKDKKKQIGSKTDKKREKDKESRARQRNQPKIKAGSARHRNKRSQRSK